MFRVKSNGEQFEHFSNGNSTPGTTKFCISKKIYTSLSSETHIHILGFHYFQEDNQEEEEEERQKKSFNYLLESRPFSK